MKFGFFAVWVVGTAMAVTSSSAEATIPVTCGTSSQAFPAFTPVAAPSCAGYYAGNIFSNSPADKVTQQDALTYLGFSGAVDFATIYNGISGLKVDFPDGSPSSLAFGFPGHQLTGITYIGIHWGKGKTDYAGGPSAIYKLDLGSVVLTSISVAAPTNLGSTQDGSSKFGGLSNAVLYRTGSPPPPVPEPATWAMMLGGLGIVGFAMRRRSARTRVNFA